MKAWANPLLIIIRRRHSRCLHVLWVDVSAWPEPRPRWRDRRDSDRLWSKVPTLGPSQRLLLLKLYTQTQNISSWLDLPPQSSDNFYKSHELSKSGGIERLVSCLRRKNFRLWISVVSKINFMYTNEYLCQLRYHNLKPLPIRNQHLNTEKTWIISCRNTKVLFLFPIILLLHELTLG